MTWQAVMKNSTDAMKDSRVFDFVNTVSSGNSFVSILLNGELHAYNSNRNSEVMTNFIDRLFMFHLGEFSSI